MKKIISIFLVFAVMMQFAVVVSAADAVISAELNIDSWTEGSDVIVGVMNATAKGKVTVASDEDGSKYIHIDDKDHDAEVGVFVSGKVGSISTISFDYRLDRNSPATGKFYAGASGWCVSVDLSTVPNHYTGSSVLNTKGSLEPGNWANITCVLNTQSRTFDLFQDGMLIGDAFPFRADTSISDTCRVQIFGVKGSDTTFDVRNLKLYDGEIIPAMAEHMKDKLATADRQLIDFAHAPELLDETLENAVAMSIGNSMARVNNRYVHIYPDDDYAAPYVSDEGHTLVPARFAAEAIGCDVEALSLTSFRISKNGTVIEFNTGDKNAIINGTAVEMPAAPVIRRDRLYVPVRFAAEYFGKKVFWDDRGLIVISDAPVVNTGDEDVIKPLLTQIRHYTTVFGNKKYSDVTMSSRELRTDGWSNGQWGTLDATKRFMATVDMWTYTFSGEKYDKRQDQGLLVQATLNAQARDDKELMNKATSFFIDGTPRTRSDMAGVTTWGCVHNEEYKANVYERATRGVEEGIFFWQFDDWAINIGYDAACFCDLCMTEFTKYVQTEVTPERLEQVGITDVDNFNYKTWLKDVKGVTTVNQYNGIYDTPIDLLWREFKTKAVAEFHKDLIAYMNELAGEEIYMQFNYSNIASSIRKMPRYNFIFELLGGIQGETAGGATTGAALYESMLVSRALGIDNVISPLPKTDSDKKLMYSAIPMTYATGQFMLVPWDDWLFGSTRYFATVEELGGSFEFVREYPFLFDNYEIPEKIGYVFDYGVSGSTGNLFERLLDDGIPATALVRMSGEYPLTFTEDNLKGIDALVAATDLSGLTADEQTLINNSGLPLYHLDDEALRSMEDTCWTAREIADDEDVFTVLRQNQLYDNAPTVVHVVNYNTLDKHNVEIEVNNMYLPAGDTLTVNVYRPKENSYTKTVQKGQHTTKFTLDAVDLWAVLEFCGPNTIRRGANFDLGSGINGIGLGTRISNDKVYGKENDFTIVTYSEGLNSTTYGDESGNQDEAAFVYEHMQPGTFRNASVNATFESDNCTYGVMVREGLYSNARFVGLVYDKANGLRLAQRVNTNKRVRFTDISDECPEYMRLERRGAQYIALVSDNGKDFEEVGVMDAEYANPVGGVFANSPDGGRGECRVKDMWISNGNYPAGEEFADFNIGYKDGRLDKLAIGERLELEIATDNYENLSVEDVDVVFESSDESVLTVTDDGTLVPGKTGSVIVKATASMGFRRVTDSLVLEVYMPETTMYKQSFDLSVLPEEYNVLKQGGIISVKDGAFTATTKENMQEANATFKFEQKSMPAVFEFDFKAHFGKTSPTTGARVIYACNSAISLTAGPNGFNWFYGAEQTHIMPIEEDKWYHIKIEANYKDQWANVYIDGELLVDKGECRSPISADGNVQLGAWRVGTDSTYQWDNLNFYFVESFD